jgi:hypothetical protein
MIIIYVINIHDCLTFFFYAESFGGGILFIDFQMLSPFLIPHLPKKPPFLSPPPASMRVYLHPLLPPHPHIPLHWGTKDQWPPLPLVPNKAILCYICGWSHGYSLVAGLVPRSSGWLILLFFLWGCKPLQLLQSFL